MTEKLATVEDPIRARVEQEGAGRGGSVLSYSASDRQRVGSLHFGCGYLSPYFVTDPERMEAVFEGAYILIHENRISSKSALMPLLEQITESGEPLLIIAEDVGGEALAALVVKKLRGPLQVAAVRARGSSDQRKRILRDIALHTGGRVITEGPDVQLGNGRISDLGRAKKVTVGKNSTLLEGWAEYELVSFEPEARIPANNQTSTGQAIRTRDRRRPSWSPFASSMQRID